RLSEFARADDGAWARGELEEDGEERHHSGLLARGEATGTHGRGVALDGREPGAGELGADALVVVAGKVLAEVFAGLPVGEVGAEEFLDGFGAVFGGGAETDRTARSGIFADRAADAEVEGIDHLAVLLDLLAFEADIGDPVLAAGVGAACDVQPDLLVETGKTVFHLADEPLGETHGFGDGELAELGAGAGDGAAEERRGLDAQVHLTELVNQLAHAFI